MNFLKHIAFLLIFTSIMPLQAAAFVKTENSDAAINFASEIGLENIANSDLDSLATKSELIQLLVNSAGIDSTLNVNSDFKFLDVPGEFEGYAEKARVTGLVYYNPAAPYFGFNDNISVKQALDLSLKFYGLNPAKFLSNPEVYKNKITNYSETYIYAPLIERGYNLGLIETKSGSVDLFAKITKNELINLVYNLHLVQSNIGNSEIKLPKFKVKSKDPVEQKVKSSNKMKIFEDVYKRINLDYYNKLSVDKEKLIYDAIEAMVEGLDDPHTSFQIPEVQKAFKDSLNNNVEGIGASMNIENNKLKVVSPLPDSPALKAGIQAGDIISKINGESTSGLSLSEAVLKIKGKSGTSVILTIDRNGKIFDLKVVRDSIDVANLTVQITSNNIAIVTIRNFGLGVEDTFQTYADQFKEKSVKAVIFDLRNNPGGYLNSAVDIAKNFIDKNKLIATVKYANGESKQDYSTDTPALKSLRTAVLINKGSASASEILAAALDEQAGAVLIGEKSYGKGSVQELITYSDNSALKMTVAHWLTPSGKDINGIGISPEYYVSITDTDKKYENDPVLNKAISILSK